MAAPIFKQEIGGHNTNLLTKETERTNIFLWQE